MKALTSRAKVRRRFVSGPSLTAAEMVAGTLEAVKGWTWDAVTVGIPAPVRGGKLIAEPANLGNGWVGFDYEGGVREADAGRERRGHAGSRKLRGRAHALPRPRYGPRVGDDRGRRDRAAGARPPPVPQEDVRGLRRRARSEEARQEEVDERPCSRSSRNSPRQWSRTTSCSEEAASTSSTSYRRAAVAARTRTPFSAGFRLWDPDWASHLK